MEVFAILLGILFWPAAIVVWILYTIKRKPARRIRICGTVLIIGMPMLAVLSMGKYMFLDEPLVFAVRDGNVTKVKWLLTHEADANISVEGNLALEQAAAEGNAEIVHLLLAYGANTNAENERSHRTALESALSNGHTDIVTMLKNAGAVR